MSILWAGVRSGVGILMVDMNPVKTLESTPYVLSSIAE